MQGGRIELPSPGENRNPTLAEQSEEIDKGQQEDMEQGSNAADALSGFAPSAIKDGKILGKFASADALVEAYQNLERKMGAPKPDSKPAEPAVPSAATPSPLDKFVDEFAANQSLSEESIAELETMGYPRSIVDDFIAGQAARGQQTAGALLAEVGGQEAWQKIVDWALQNVPRPELEAFNQQLALGESHARAAMKGLAALYTAGSPRDPVHGGRGGSPGPAPYTSQEMMIRDMQNPAYQLDPAFRKQVAERVRVTNF